MKRLCDLCGENEADLRFREVHGWEEKREAGGANKIIGRRETDRRACRSCIDRIRFRVAVGQETIL